MKMIKINPVYEIDTVGDVEVLLKEWYSVAVSLETASNNSWRNYKEYPTFEENKSKRLEIDKNLILEFVCPNDRVVDIGAGMGYVCDMILNELPIYYFLVEPNKYWCSAISERLYIYKDFVKIISKSFKEYLEIQEIADISILFGCISFFITDDSLIDCLKSLNSKKLLIKTSEPRQEMVDRLLINEYSQNLGFHYVCLYRSVSDVCEILRKSGWCVREIKRNIYDGMENQFGNKTFLVYAVKFEDVVQ